MDSHQIPGARTRAVVARDLPSPSALLAIASIAILLGVRVFVWVDTGREGDDSISGLVPWLMYPGIVAAMAVRSRVERPAIGVAAIVPVAVFAILFGRERVEAVGPAILAYVALLLISVVAASRFARRPGLRGAVASIAGGAAAFLLTVGVTVVVLLAPIY